MRADGPFNSSWRLSSVAQEKEVDRRDTLVPPSVAEVNGDGAAKKNR